MYLGIDLGTSEVKVLLLASDGSVIGTAGTPFTVSRPKPRWSEQNPLDWWDGTRAALLSLREKFPGEFAQVRGIGLSGQMHGAVLLDSTDRVLRPAILWNDMRSDKECAELTERAPELHRVAGNLAMPGFTAPKLLWVAHNEPDIFSADRLRAAAEGLPAAAPDRRRRSPIRRMPPARSGSMSHAATGRTNCSPPAT